jgi:hypothetical protein
MQSLFDQPAIIAPKPPVTREYMPTDGFTAAYLYDSPNGRTREEIEANRVARCPTLPREASDRAIEYLMGHGFVTCSAGIYRHTKARAI